MRTREDRAPRRDRDDREDFLVDDAYSSTTVYRPIVMNFEAEKLVLDLKWNQQYHPAVSFLDDGHAATCRSDHAPRGKP